MGYKNSKQLANIRLWYRCLAEGCLAEGPGLGFRAREVSQLFIHIPNQCPKTPVSNNFLAASRPPVK